MADETKTEPNGALAVQSARTSLLSKEEQAKRRRQKLANRDYGRGKGVDVRGVRDKKLRTNMKKQEEKYQNAISKAKDAEILLENAPGFLEPDHELERTYRVRQDEITSETAVGTAQKRFDLKLDDLGPYHCEYTRNGKELLLAGRKGHIATMDFREGKLGCELQLGETIRGRLTRDNIICDMSADLVFLIQTYGGFTTTNISLSRKRNTFTSMTGMASSYIA